MNEYTAIAGVSRSHDDNGNLLVDRERVMAYDYKNRLVAVTDAATGNPVAEYRYYADNRRAEKRVFSETAPGVLDEATAFFWDGWRCCEEQDGQTGETETTYVWSPVYVDELVQFERTAAHDLGAGRFWVHQDARADVVAVTDAAGSVVERRFYDDFGRLLDAQKEPTTESVTGLEYGFQGRRLDAETGLVYFRNRYYDPGTGRFVQRDPVWDASNVGGWYTFVGNGPWSHQDPLGLSPISVAFKRGGMAAAKRAIKRFIRNRIRRELGDLAEQGVGRSLLNAADNILTVLESSWLELAIECIPIFGDSFGIANFKTKLDRAHRKLRGLERAARAARRRADRRAGITRTERPTWRQTERDVEALTGGEGQVTFLGGTRVRGSPRGSTRPDSWIEGDLISFEAKNYDLSCPSGLVSNVAEQATERARHLPPGSTQKVVIDVRGQSVDRERLVDVARRIQERSGGAIDWRDVGFLTD